MGVCKTLIIAALSFHVLATEDCSDETCTSPQFLQVHREVQARVATDVVSQQHFWPTARGPIPQSGSAKEAWTTHELAWKYADPLGQYHNLFAGGAVIDRDENLFQMTQKGLLAFDKTGKQLWHYDTPGISNNEPALYEDLVLGSTKTEGKAFAVNRLSGEEVWVTKLAEDAGGDCGYPAAYDGVFVVGAQKNKEVDGGNERVFGLNVTNGQKMWEYDVDKPVWNLTPLFPGDGTCVFMDFAGGVYRLNLHTGKVIWRTLPSDSRDSFSDGGAGLGPNDMVYTCSNPELSHGDEGSKGIVRAFHLSNGTEVWHKVTSFPCNSYPAIGEVAGFPGLSVVVTPGSFMGKPDLHGSVLAFEAMTGKPIWSIPVAPYQGVQAAGDLEGTAIRLHDGLQPVCLPAHWSAPIIDGAGQVIVGRADGAFYCILGPDAGYTGLRLDRMKVTEDGILFDRTPLGSAFLHGALAAAPNMFAMSTCDTLYVFQKKS